MAANFCPAHGLCSTVKTITGNVLEIADDAVELDLCNTLSQGDPAKYTRLMLSVGVGYEEFKVQCVGGCLKLTPTPTTQFSPGDKVWYESCSQANIEDTLACINEADNGIDTEPEFKIEGFILSTDDSGNQCWVPDPELKQSVTFQVGKQVITIDGGGCATSKPAQPGTYPVEGEYPYATITVGPGCFVTGIKEGTRPVSGSCGTGCCGKCNDAITEAGSV